MLFRRHWKELFYYCRKRLNDEDAGKDVAEESFIKLWENIEKMESDAHVKRFLFKCALNACVNLEQAIKRRHHILPLEKIKEEDEPGEEIDFNLINTEVIAGLYKEIENLSSAKRRIMECYLKGLKTEQIAKEMGTTCKTVLNQKLTAISQLHERLKLKFDI